MTLKYLDKKIVDLKRTHRPQYGMSANGYTHRSGAPTNVMIKLEGDRIWRRVMCIQTSNVGSFFIKMKGSNYYIQDWMLDGFDNN